MKKIVYCVCLWFSYFFPNVIGLSYAICSFYFLFLSTDYCQFVWQLDNEEVLFLTAICFSAILSLNIYFLSVQRFKEWERLFARNVQVKKNLFAGTVPVYKNLLPETVLANKNLFARNCSGK